MDLTVARDIENSGNYLKYADSDKITEKFLDTMMKFIIDYPIVWKNFVENVLKNNIAICHQGLMAMIYEKVFPQNIQIVIDHTLDYVKRSGIIESVYKEEGVYYIKFINKEQQDFFIKTGLWLEYLTYYTLRDIFEKDLHYDIHISQGNLIKLGNIKKFSEVDVIGSVDNHYFVIECKDTNLYSEDDYKKLRKIAKKIYNKKAKRIFITTKYTDKDIVDSKKYRINFITYNGNYLSFKEELIFALSN